MTGYFCMDFQAKFLSFPVDAPNNLFFFQSCSAHICLLHFQGGSQEVWGKKWRQNLQGDFRKECLVLTIFLPQKEKPCLMLHVVLS